MIKEINNWTKPKAWYLLFENNFIQKSPGPKLSRIG